MVSEHIRAVLHDLWPAVEWTLNKVLDFMEWLVTKHEPWFDRLVAPLIERAAA